MSQSRHPWIWLRGLAPLLVAPAIPYGGQAAIEGVLMKGKEHAALAMRRSDGSIEVLQQVAKSRFPALTRLPLVRGFFILWDMMTLGLWALTESGRRFEADLAVAEAEAKGQAAPESDLHLAPKLGLLQVFTMAVAFGVALFMFKVLPAIAATYIFQGLGWGALKELAEPTFGQQLLANLVEGIIKLGIFVGYIWLVGRLKEIQRVFEYHGAEHIVINAYESDPQNQSLGFIQRFGVAHPRCGTSFLVILILLGVLLFTVLDWAILHFWPSLAVNNLPVPWIRWPLRIVALPLLAGLSYEVIKGAFRYYTNPLLRPLLRFGMLFQTLTTRRPSDAQIVVSLASFNRARYLTEGVAEPPLPTSPVLR